MRKNYSKNILNLLLLTLLTLSLSSIKASNSTNTNDIAPPCNQPDVPTVNAGSTKLCFGSSTLLIVTAGNLNDAANWTWHTDSANGQLVGTGDTLYAQPTTTTTYFVRGEGNCVGTSATAQSVTITVNLIPTLTASANPTTLCAGNNITLTASGSGKITWNKSVTNGTPFFAADSATYVVTSTDTVSGCSTSSTFFIGYLPPAPIAINSNTCIGAQNVNPNVLPLNGYSLKWYDAPVGGNVSYTTPVVPTNAVQSFTYYVSQIGANVSTASNQNGVSYGYQGTVQGQTFQIPGSGILSSISVSISTWIGAIDSTFYTMRVYDSLGGTLLATASNIMSTPPSSSWTYTGGNFNFTSAGLNIVPGKSYYFEVSSSGSSFLMYASYSDNYAQGAGYVNGSAIAGLDFVFTATATQYGCEGPRDTVTVSVYPVPHITAITSADTICKGNTVTLTAQGGQSYSWTNNVQNATAFTPSDSATYIVTGTDSLGCSNTASVFVAVKHSPSLNVTSSNNSLCVGNTLALTATTDGKFTWTPAITNGVPFTATDSATYSVTAIDTVTGCSTSTSVFVAALPPAPTVSNLNTCLGTQGMNPAVTGLNGYTVNWYPSFNGGVANTTTPTVPTDSAKSFTYYVSQLLINNYSAGNSAAVSFGYAGTTQGQTFVMPVTSVLNYISVNISTWFGATDTTIYTMKLYDSFGGNLLATAINTMSTPPSTGWTYTGGNFNFNPITLIGGKTYYFEVSSSDSQFLFYASYSNNYADGDMYVNGNLQSGADVTFTANANQYGCESNRDSAIVSVYYNPTVKVTASTNLVCAGTPVTLTASDAGQGYGVAAPGRVENNAVATQFNWTNNVINNVAFAPTDSATYIVTAVDTLTGCSVTASTFVGVNPRPDNSVIVTDTNLTVGQSGANYNWVDCNNAYASILGDTNQVMPIVQSGNFAAIINLNGCVDTTACQLVINTGINKLANQKVTELYPNPNAGMFTLKTNQLGIYKIIDELGQVVQTMTVTTPEETIIHLDNAKTGLYYLVGTNNAYNQVISVVR